MEKLKNHVKILRDIPTSECLKIGIIANMCPQILTLGWQSSYVVHDIRDILRFIKLY